MIEFFESPRAAGSDAKYASRRERRISSERFTVGSSSIILPTCEEMIFPHRICNIKINGNENNSY